MTDLVACLSTGKGTWIPVIRLMNSGCWNRIILIATEFAKENFKSDKKVDFIVVDPEKPMKELVIAICNGMDGKISGTEVAVNLASGSGKEHMAVISAVLRQGVGLRLVYASEKGSVEEI
jgi:hypothetical protein